MNLHEYQSKKLFADYGIPVPSGGVAATADGQAGTDAHDAHDTLGPLFLMERIDGISITDTLPAAYPDPAAAAQSFGPELVDNLAQLHAVDWQAAGLGDFGRDRKSTRLNSSH